MDKARSDASLELKKIENKVARIERDGKDAKERVLKLEQQHPWIGTEKALFGKAGSDYDWCVRTEASAGHTFRQVPSSIPLLALPLCSWAVALTWHLSLCLTPASVHITTPCSQRVSHLFHLLPPISLIPKPHSPAAASCVLFPPAGRPARPTTP